jgi:transcription antitermination factor NusB
MAVQMLFQLDLGGSSVTAKNVFSRYNQDEYSRASTKDVDSSLPTRSPTAKETRETGSSDTIDQEDQAAAFVYARQLVEGTVQRKAEIDELIRSQTDHWRLERMPAVDRNILRLAIYEFLSEEDVPKLVVIDEAIELAKRFGSEQSGRFVNGLLDGLLKERAFPGTIT